MKCMFVIDSNLSGGAERVISLLANYFEEKNNQVYLLNFDADSDFYPMHEKVNIIKLAKEYPDIQNERNKLKRKLKIVKYTRKEIKSLKPDVVVPFLFDAEFAVIPYCCFHKIACFTSVRNDAEAYPKYQRFFRKLFYPHISGVVFQSKSVREHKDFIRLKNACVIANPLSLPIIEHRDVAIDNNKFISVGRLTKQKNHELTIKAFSEVVKKHKQVKLYIYGEGILEKELTNLINELNLDNNVFLEGVVENAQYNNREAMGFVMSSNYEGFPNALVEAMACHIPVICTDFASGTSRELIGDNERGLLIPVNDLDQLIMAIEAIINDSKTSEEKADKAAIKCKELDYRSIGKEWERLFLGETS